MSYIAQKVEVNGDVELFTTKEVEDVDGNVVTIKQSVGVFNLTQLNNEKTNLQKQIDEINIKLSAIENVE